MNKERAAEIEFLRGELVGPARPLVDVSPGVTVVIDSEGCFKLTGEVGATLYYQPSDEVAVQEIVHYRGETPIQRYGVGLLHPRNDERGALIGGTGDIEHSVHNTANLKLGDSETSETILTVVSDPSMHTSASSPTTGEPSNEDSLEAGDDDFEVNSEDMYQPSVMGISFCLEDSEGEFVVALPSTKRFFWQLPNTPGFPVNGRYEPCYKIMIKDGIQHKTESWKRVPATNDSVLEKFSLSSLQSGKKESRKLNIPGELELQIQVFPRRLLGKWIITCVLRNMRDAKAITRSEDKIRSILFQSYFEVRVNGGASFSSYPESVRPFTEFDEDEQTLSLLYRNECTWAIGHGCAAGWEHGNETAPDLIFADSMPAVELPSMTPDIRDKDGNPITLAMRTLACLPSFSADHEGWLLLERLANEYKNWIEIKTAESLSLSTTMRKVAERHLDSCKQCLKRIRGGIDTLKKNGNVLEAFRLANQSMLLQQIATKQIVRRPLAQYNGYVAAAELPADQPRTPWDIWVSGSEKLNIGTWRAFQAAFLLLSINGLVEEDSADREIVDLIWFPTGGGKTEAYLAVASFYMFYQRLITKTDDKLARDGTNVFMRYTLRMLTTQQFQRASSLICAMEQIRVRRNKEPLNYHLGTSRFSLGLWIGGSASPNTWSEASAAIRQYERDDISGNPLVLTECPWCRSTIGRLGKANKAIKGSNLAGLAFTGKQPYLKCSDVYCDFGGELDRLPVEVIDEAIYRTPPSMFIGTADKLAMMAWKPETGALFGLQHGNDGPVTRVRRPPGLIIQDEFHLISGPLGTIYGLYEGVIEQLCTVEDDVYPVRPKIIASTATIRGAKEQVSAIYAREKLQLFPSPGLEMGDSFFGRYAVRNDGVLAEGRLYLGIHATGYRSFLTAQVRAFSAVLFRAWMFEEDQRDAWWTLLAFYNSLRELSGAQTLFQSDISARLKDYSLRYGLKGSPQRYLNTIEELTSRQSQAQLVELMDRLALKWDSKDSLDVCLASNIIEVGVDIDRLALMAVVGQPKSTAQYIQVTGRVGRRWMDRPGLILSMFNPGKSRDRSHFEQFHSYHRRLYERVEPTSATPFSVEAVERALAGAILLLARQRFGAKSPGEAFGDYSPFLDSALECLLNRCAVVMRGQSDEMERVCKAMRDVYTKLITKWQTNPQEWWSYPHKKDGEYLMLWSGEFASREQKRKGVRVLSSMRNVDGTARAVLSSSYFERESKENG